jgi:hypothetical protein
MPYIPPPRPRPYIPPRTVYRSPHHVHRGALPQTGPKVYQNLAQYQKMKQLKEQVMHGFFESLKKVGELIGDMRGKG